MLLSIIVPIYNQEKYLSRCLDSIYNQGLREENFELLLINDGSTDNSLAIMQSYADQHSNVRIISKDNEGLSATRNRGIKEAIGDYIYMPDSDDYLIANGLSYVIKNFLNGDIDVLVFYSTTILPEKLKDFPEIVDGEIVYDGLGRDFLKDRFNFPAWNQIIKTSILKKWLESGQVFDERTTMEDTMFNVDLGLQNPRYLVVNSNIYRYITNPNSEITTKNPIRLRKHINSYIIIFKNLQNRIDNEIDIDVKNRLISVANGIYTPFTSRLLASDLSYKEIKDLTHKLKVANILPPKKKIFRLLFDFPALFIPSRWAYKYCFVPFILPVIKRHNA